MTSPPRIPPSNLTVVTVEGCPSFVILDWQKSDNETTGRADTALTLKLPRSCSLARPVTKVINVAAHILPSFRVRNSLHHQRRKWGGEVCGDHQSDTHGCGEPQTREQVRLHSNWAFILTLCAVIEFKEPNIRNHISVTVFVAVVDLLDIVHV